MTLSSFTDVGYILSFIGAAVQLWLGWPRESHNLMLQTGPSAAEQRRQRIRQKVLTVLAFALVVAGIMFVRTKG